MDLDNDKMDKDEIDDCSEYEETDLENESTNDDIESLPDEAIDLDIETKTSPYLTRYEKAKIIGIRAEQINDNHPILLPLCEVKNMNSFQIAEYELKQGLIKFTIRRYIGSNKHEDVRVCDLKLK